MEKEDFIFKTINNLQDEIVKLKEEIKNISKDKNEESSNKEIAYNIDKITATLNVHTAHISALEKRTSRWTDKLKFGRFKPNHTPHYDEVLGIKLCSDNQRGVQIC